MKKAAKLPFLLVTFSLISALAGQDVQGLQNGDFEERTGWLFDCGSDIFCPDRQFTPGVPGYQEFASFDSSTAMRIGRSISNPPVDGFPGARIGQTFQLGEDPDRLYAISFRARFTARDGEIVRFHISNQETPNRLAAPDLVITDRWETFRFTIQGCSNTSWVLFSIVENFSGVEPEDRKPGIQSTLLIDNVKAECTDEAGWLLGEQGDPEGQAVDVRVCFGAPCALAPRDGVQRWWIPLQPFTRGDYAQDGNLILSDAIAMLLYLFRGGAPSPCPKAADTNDNGVLELTDAIIVLNHLFLGGIEPSAPFAECGFDATTDFLSCDESTCDA